jgi:AcrR family transcriptional regulator
MALIELIAQRGYPAVRVLDLSKLARVSLPTLYSLYKDKEALLLAVYDEIAERAGKMVRQALDGDGSVLERRRATTRAFTELAAAEPETVSLFVLGALGAGAKALQRRNRMLEALEETIRAGLERASTAAGDAPRPQPVAGSRTRDPRVRAPGRRGQAQPRRSSSAGPARRRLRAGDLTVKLILGGIREVTATRLRQGHASELPGLADELAAWSHAYPLALPAGLEITAPARRGAPGEALLLGSERRGRAQGRLPSGRHDLPRQLVVNNQRERIVDATAEIVAAKGLAGLTIPEIAQRANVSHQTFYELYATKHDAFLGAQKVGMHTALQVAVDAYDAHKEDWPHAVAAGLRALIDYLASEPAHTHLSLVDTFAASPETLAIRDRTLRAFASYLIPGYELAEKELAVPAIAAEVTVGGIWQLLHYYAENGCVAELPGAAPQLVYLALTPFLGPERATKAALSRAATLPAAV